ncbi:lanthionine synthetase LanC family protein [Nocardia sp. NPDC048505]|uniref:lanthionine synthetase LanC family protein n=1 Tax=unclassified Nocardia TaxID=2637762 RepID=UPI0033D16B11
MARAPIASGSDLRAATVAIADALLGAARVGRDSGLHWCYPDTGAGPTALGPHLFAGSSGIAVFFAALSKVDDTGRYREAGLRTIAALRADLRAITADPARARRLEQPIGGLTGLGSLVYALVRIGDLLGDDSLLDDAQRAATLLTTDRLTATEAHDVMTGSAGAVLALLALAERRPEPVHGGERPMDLALRCAERLAGSEGWTTAKGPAAAGFCHGRAGIRAALARLAERTGHGAPALLAAEMPHAEAWRHSWCKGAAGIALGCLAMPGDRPIPAEALDLAAAPTLSGTDDLCCGNSGRIDVLVYAGIRLDRPDYLDRAARLAAEMMRRAQAQGGYSFKSAAGGLDPRLFPGLAGIGYALSRLQAAERVPCVTAME